MICGYGEDHYNAIKVRNNKLTKNNDTLKEPIILPAGFAIIVKRKDGGPQVHCKEDHNGWSFKICLKNGMNSDQ